MSTRNKLHKKFEYKVTSDPARLMPKIRPHAEGHIGLMLLDVMANEPGSAKELDRQFFEANPERSLRLRRLVDGEMPIELGGPLLRGATHVLVCKRTEITREKRAIPTHVTAAELDAIPDTDAVLEPLWKVLTDPHQIFTVRDVLYPREGTGGVH